MRSLRAGLSASHGLAWNRTIRAFIGPGSAAALLITLSACATDNVTPQVIIKTVDVPIQVKCKPDIGPEPAYPDTDAALKAAPDLFSRVQLLVAGRLERIARDQVKGAALSACAG